MRLLAFTVIFLTLAVFAETQPPLALKIGKFESRAYFTAPPCGGGCVPKPAIILIPGSGPIGPEENVPGIMTEDGKDHSLFGELTEPLLKAGFNVLALGKPGVDFFSVFQSKTFFYNENLYKNLHWSDLVANIREAHVALRDVPTVNPDHIYLLGHSEGTQVAVDYATENSGIRGLFLLGYWGDDMETILKWQLYDRVTDLVLKTDCDKDHDGKITRAEAAIFPELNFMWKEGKEFFTYSEMTETLKGLPKLNEIYKTLENFPLYSKGIFQRGNIDDKTASLSSSVYLFTGDVDSQTPKSHALRLEEVCKKKKKLDCQIDIVPGLGHAFSRPRPPRRNPVFDSTAGGINKDFQDRLETFATKLVPKSPL